MSVIVFDQPGPLLVGSCDLTLIYGWPTKPEGPPTVVIPVLDHLELEVVISVPRQRPVPPQAHCHRNSVDVTTRLGFGDERAILSQREPLSGLFQLEAVVA